MRIKLKPVLFISVFLVFAQCKKDEKPESPNNGIEYFRCKINGNEFQTSSDVFGCNGILFNYYPEEYLNIGAGSLRMRGRNCDQYEVIGIRLDGFFANIDSLSFIEPLNIDSGYPYYSAIPSLTGSITTYENVLNGNMIIEHFYARSTGANTPYGSIKGTFKFTVTDSMAIDTFRITDGSFRFDVPQIF